MELESGILLLASIQLFMISSRSEVTDLDRLADDLTGALSGLGVPEQRLAVALDRLLAEGEPVSTERLGAAVGLEGDRASELLRAWPNVFYDDPGHVVAFGGLALSKMPHRFLLDGRTLYTWCAWDALFVPIVLGRDAHVESATPGTGEPVRLTVTPSGVREAAPEGAVLSFVRPPKFDSDVIRNFCHHVHFFASREAGEGWASRREDAFFLSLEEGFELGRRWVESTFGEALKQESRAL